MLEVAAFDADIGVDSYDACRTSIVRGVTLQFTVDHFDACTIKDCNTRHFTIRLPENSTKEENQLIT